MVFMNGLHASEDRLLITTNNIILYPKHKMPVLHAPVCIPTLICMWPFPTDFGRATCFTAASKSIDIVAISPTCCKNQIQSY